MTEQLSFEALVKLSYQSLLTDKNLTDAKARFYQSINTPQFIEVVKRFIPFRDSIYVAPSPIHGNGLFASGDIPNNQLVTVYPVHYYTVSDGKIFNFTGDTSCQPDKTVLRDYCVNVGKGLIVGDPNRVSDREFLSHLANDGAMLQNTGNLALDLAEYLDRIGECNNCKYEQIGPLVALKTVKPVSSGGELLVSYHWSYWIPRSYGIAKLDSQMSEIAKSVRRLKFQQRRSLVKLLQSHDPIFNTLRY